MNKNFKMTTNKFADQTHEEFSNKYLAPIGKRPTKVDLLSKNKNDDMEKEDSDESE